MKTSTLKSDIDIDVLAITPSIEITKFEKVLFQE